MPYLLALIALPGWAVGAFLTVLIDRIPAGQPLRAVLTCSVCRTSLRPRYARPAAGWLSPPGRCAGCGTPSRARYRTIQLSTGLVFVTVTFTLYRTGQTALLPAWLYFTAAAVALTVIDLDCRRLPNAIVLPSYPVLAVLLGAAATWQRDYPAMIRSVIGGLLLFGGYFVLAVSYPQAMGFGDVKLAGLVGGMLAYLSYPALLLGGFGAFLLGGIAGTVVILSGRGTRKTALPFGPFMLSAALLALFFTQPIVSSYRQFTSG